MNDTHTSANRNNLQLASKLARGNLQNEIDTKDNGKLQNYTLLNNYIFYSKIDSYGVCFQLSHSLRNEVRVIEGKIIKKKLPD